MKQVRLAARPTGFPDESHFDVVECDVPKPGPGEVLVRVEWASVDPYQRGRMSEARSYAKPVEIGEVMTAQAAGEVVESHDARFSPGDKVVGTLGWQEYAVARGGALRKVPDGIPLQWSLHVLGTNGLTAYFGLFDVGKPTPGDTVVVSAAAGAVGQVVGQLAKIAGCRAVGIAGGPEKAKELMETFGYDAGVDYKADDFADSLKRALPDGVDVYFDNVGGAVSAAVYGRLNVGARIAVCGQVSMYNDPRPQPTLHPGLLIVYRAKMEGFLVSDYAARFDEAIPRLARWLAEGKIRYTEDVVEGIEQAPAALLRVLRGENRGKQLVRCS
ncbi:MAG: NADP-dependent oxidoreductase [Gaiellaceae bacterium]